MALFFYRGSLFWCSVYRYRTLVSFAFVWVSVPFASAFVFLLNVLVLFVHFCVHDPFMSRADWTSLAGSLVQLKGRQYVRGQRRAQAVPGCLFYEDARALSRMFCCMSCLLSRTSLPGAVIAFEAEARSGGVRLVPLDW